MAHKEDIVKFQMDEGGESISNYLNRTGGDLSDYEQALSDFKLNIANEKGLSDEELHKKSPINPEITKQIFMIAKMGVEGSET